MAVSVGNQWGGSAGSAGGLYGSMTIAVSNPTGPWLIVVAAIRSNSSSTVPLVQVCDDARNYWVPIYTSPATVGWPRICVWAAPSARAATLVSISTSGYVDGASANVYQVSGLPTYVNVDVTAVTSNAGSSITVTANPTTADMLLAVAAANGFWSPGTPTGTGTWNALASNGSVGGVGGDLGFVAAWQQISSGGAYSCTQTVAAANSTAVMIGFNLTATAPAQPTPNWPAVQYQVAWGYQPGDPTSLPTWTDITPKVSALSCKRGRQYELDKLQAGTAAVDFRNNSGDFDPTNASSPYAPNVVPYAPIRCLATWNGSTYPVFSGYVERWPQSWDGSRYGWSKAAAVDTLAPLAAVTLPSAVASEILQDQPYAYWPLDEPSGASSASNASARAQTTLTQVATSGGVGPATAGFGAQIGLAGDTGTGWQQQGVTSTSGLGYLLTCYDRALPSLSSGIGIEVWAQYPTSDLSLGPAYMWSLSAAGGGQGTGTFISGGMGTLTGSTQNGVPSAGAGAGGLTDTTASAGTYNFVDGKWHHFFTWLTTTNIKTWVDGTKVIDHNWAMTLGGGLNYLALNGLTNGPFSQAGFNIAVAHCAIYDQLPSQTRITAHYQSGATGFSGEGTGTRSQRILSYGSWTQARLVDAGDTNMQAAADLLGKSVPDALGDAFDTEIGLPSVDGAGTIRIRARHFTYNRPVQWTLDELSGTPFAGDISFDFDPTFVDNKITVSRNKGGLGVAKDSASQKANFVRALPRTSYAAADQDAVDQANWLLGWYKAPHLRVSEVTLDPASNPSVWPVALGVDVGDVVSVTRRPTYAPAISGIFVVQQVAHDVAPGKWQTKITLAPTPPPVLTCDDATYGVLGTTNVLGW